MEEHELNVQGEAAVPNTLDIMKREAGEGHELLPPPDIPGPQAQGGRARGLSHLFSLPRRSISVFSAMLPTPTSSPWCLSWGGVGRNPMNSRDLGLTTGRSWAQTQAGVPS